MAHERVFRARKHAETRPAAGSACRERNPPLAGPSGLFRADGQTFPALRAPSLENESAVFRAHTLEEAVTTLPAQVVRLESALALHETLAMDEPTMLRAFSKGVNARAFVLESRSFTERRTHAGTSCAFGLSPKFSTPVEKAVEIGGYEPLGAGARTRRNQGK